MLDGFKRAAFVFCDLLRFFLGGGWLCCEVAIFLMLRCLVGLNIRRFAMLLRSVGKLRFLIFVGRLVFVGKLCLDGWEA